MRKISIYLSTHSLSRTLRDLTSERNQARDDFSFSVSVLSRGVGVGPTQWSLNSDLVFSIIRAVHVYIHVSIYTGVVFFFFWLVCWVVMGQGKKKASLELKTKPLKRDPLPM